MQRRPLLAALGAGLMAPGTAWSQTAPPPLPPVEVRQHLGATTRLHGAARLRMWGLAIYDARLWVGEAFQASRFEAAPLALELIYARSLKGPLIAERSVEEMRRGGPLADAEEQRWLGFMKRAFPDVGQGDRLTGTWDPVTGQSQFHVNGGAPQALRDAGFGARFFGIWLAPHSSQPEMRKQLLGLGS
jgi:hypothetical protein